MKKKLFLIIALFIGAISMNAQLTVLSSGNVKLDKYLAVNNAEISDSVVLCVNTPQIGNGQKRYGVYSSVEALRAQSFMINGGRNVCIFGQVTPYHLPTPLNKSDQGRALGWPFQAATVGLASSGVGIYGATGSVLPQIWNKGSFAGYFDGNVTVTGTLTATTVTQTSDSRFKENISSMQNDDVMNVLSRLNPVSYTFRNDSNLFCSPEKASATHYGLIAQEVQQILPEMVYEDGAGYLSINYTEFIPFLIRAINVQQKQIENLQAQLEIGDNSNNYRSARYGNSQGDATIEEAILYQNNPNPFTADTEIEYQLPVTTKQASLYIYNMNGLQVAEYPITTFGGGSVVVTGGNLEAGMYLYSLIADGQVIDTKRMILTK